jgi:hypothetical protein
MGIDGVSPSVPLVQSEDISVHFRPNRSVHGGNAFSGDEGSRRGLRRRIYIGSKEDLREKSLKKASSAVVLSELELEGSYHGWASLA